MTTPAPPLTEEELSALEELDRACQSATTANLMTRLLAQARRALTLESELAQLRRENEELVRGVVANAGRLSRRKPRWAHVRDAVGVGSTSARELCRDAGLDPEELVGNP